MPRKKAFPHHSMNWGLNAPTLNSLTGIVNTTQCASYSVSRLPRNLKITFSFWFTLVYLYVASFFSSALRAAV